MENQLAELKNEIEALRTAQEELQLLLGAQKLLFNAVAATLDKEKKQAISQAIYEMLNSHAVFSAQEPVVLAARDHLLTFANLMAQQANEQSPE
ncbi:hypothetical protein [[Mannheimia] succiniciproducens]|uniref:Uncharacterized protein n=1 Tax=Mannheimia succiniciproducens (strain KCTC 0769BP / MBEL55E) TaxID=221988 RepID=Q65WD9_MANSM|nr:hypothetical protein [[Mannheimia] succiniciproducens]AAU36721.1 unknown [[Mannheimia] succiniciproducens MBEL55E]